MSEESTPNEFTNLLADTVISLEEKRFSIMGEELTKTFLVSECTERIAERLTYPGLGRYGGLGVQAWGKNGVPAQVLISGQGWQRGRVRIGIEFCPDQPEPEADEPSPEDSATEQPEEPKSLLDDIRQTLLQNNTEEIHE